MSIRLISSPLCMRFQNHLRKVSFHSLCSLLLILLRNTGTLQTIVGRFYIYDEMMKEVESKRYSSRPEVPHSKIKF
jgi:hypothetical protein